MNNFLAENELFIRTGFFFIVFCIIALWENLSPRRAFSIYKRRRLRANLSIALINNLIIRWVFPILVFGAALKARENGWGLFNNIRAGWWGWLLSIIILDLVIYLQHVIFHISPLLWRLHRSHHSDPVCDVSTGFRFHPLEAMISMLIKLTATVALGAPPSSTLAFEILLSSAAMFNHGNIKLPEKADRFIRWFVVTPDMHIIHHSIIPSETNSNFGFNLSCWDRLFRTYQERPREYRDNMIIGINMFRHPKYLRLHWLLAQPFVDDNA